MEYLGKNFSFLEDVYITFFDLSATIVEDTMTIHNKNHSLLQVRYSTGIADLIRNHDARKHGEIVNLVVSNRIALYLFFDGTIRWTDLLQALETGEGKEAIIHLLLLIAGNSYLVQIWHESRIPNYDVSIVSGRHISTWNWNTYH